MATVRLLLAAEADIEQALQHTFHTFGTQKYAEYAALVHEALDALAENSQAGRRREDIGAGAWIYPIEKPGRPELENTRRLGNSVETTISSLRYPPVSQ